MTQDSDDVVEVDVQVAGVIEAVARELENQHLFLKCLEKKIWEEISNNSFTEIKNITFFQNIDRSIQEIEDLSRLMNVLTENINCRMNQKKFNNLLQKSLKLNSLRERIFECNKMGNSNEKLSIELF